MGKGFNNYMCKKFFHPASRDNLKRVWMAEQKADSYKKKQEELRQQYEKEQDLYTNKAILSKESKDKLSVNFMYEPPPGTKKEREREDDEPEYKFEWQRKFNAPREDYCKGDSEIRDQPFGIQVRNVRCIKCHKWGHINTDKECPMYCQSISTELASSSYDPMQLVQQMREDGLAMKRSAFTAQIHSNFLANQKLIESSDDEGDKLDNQSELEFLKSLSKEQKQRLLKKLEKLEKKSKKRKSEKKKTIRVKKEKSSSSDSEKDADKKHCKKMKKEKHKRKQIKKEPDSSPDRHAPSTLANYKNHRIKMESASRDNSHKWNNGGGRDRNSRDRKKSSVHESHRKHR